MTSTPKPPNDQDSDELQTLREEVAQLRQELEAVRPDSLDAYTVRLLADQGSDVIGIHDEEGRVIRLAGACKRLFGWSQSEWLGKRFSEFSHPDDRERLEAELDALGEGNDRFIEFRHRRADGGYVWVESGARLVPLGDERHIVTFTRDVSARRQAERSARETHELLESLAEASADAVYAKDLQGRYMLVNARACRNLGLSREEMLGKTDRELFPQEEAELAERWDREVCTREINALYTEKLTANGKPITFSTSKGVLRDMDGEVRGVFGISRDITAAARVEEQLRESEERFRLTFVNAPIGMAIVDLDDRVVRINDRLCSILGREREELRGTSLSALSHREDRELGDEQIERLVRGGIDRFQLEKRYLHRDGEEVHALVSVSLVRDPDGTPLHLIKQIADITDRKRAEDELRALSLRDQLTGLSNRRGFLALGAQQLETARRLGREAALLFVDLDGLKPINDELGHDHGDQALRDAAEVIRGAVRDSDVVGRLGGDEFAVFAMAGASFDAGGCAGRLEEALARFNQRTIRPYRLSFSVGSIVVAPDAAERSLEELIRLADGQMYAEKRARNLAR